nr:immunoglobulin heavy chain junction region [Mus musculus]
ITVQGVTTGTSM